ncbi:DHA2 family efflux MFS transporter permease subunit [Bartonella sp. HY329]|uniref:DHA2 family efflux MFS transporter permease subunit n=1 Tax=unclassified Bartonella TaxID=2645622 RepID=UPI0021C80B5B|nr:MULTISPECIES: DHA2 family efflux MFS transporter permease subunit [unclassified Bartonella]UXM95526.1 DHA2 family efflux MFS transporter permease subunit [Bartonella sp. HY329]UXN09851.1 DHA2 family efflux MFS transporter permease subunit [Bartonella sp. HY328]
MSADAITNNSHSDTINPRHVLGFIAMVFGMFMAILDIQIVSASLAEIQAGLSASSDEISWVQTSYLIAEVIMIPLSGFLGRLMSTRTLFTISAIGFTFASLLCATATSIEQMIVYRAIQGFLGGGMIPSVFAAAFTIFPPSKRSIVSPLIGLVATLAPTIGPTIGGYLSHALSWHWLFLINFIPGILVAAAAWRFIDFDKGDSSLFAKFDWWGLLFMAILLGGTEYVLEEGPRNDWMDDATVRSLTILVVISGVLFFWRAFTSKEPIVDLRAFSDVNFALGSLFSFIMGIGLYGLTYLYPLYLGQIRGYDALMIGETMFVSGLAMFFAAPLAGILSEKMDPRLMMAIGFAGFGIGTWMVTGMTADWDFWELFWPQILRGSSMMLCMVPINNIALGTLPPSRIKNASALFNLMRNLGGAIGLAAINTVIMRRSDLHFSRIAETLNWGNKSAMEFLNGLAERLGTPANPSHVGAIQELNQLVHQQAAVMAFSDSFYILTLLFGTLTILVLFVKKPSAGKSQNTGH